MTQPQFRSLEDRKRLLVEKAEKVEFLLSGRSRSVLPEVTNEDGLYSEEKTQALVDRLPEITGAFQDLPLCARRMYHPNRISLCYEELCNPARDNDFFSWMDECYELLTGLTHLRRGRAGGAALLPVLPASAGAEF